MQTSIYLVFIKFRQENAKAVINYVTSLQNNVTIDKVCKLITISVSVCL